MDRLMELTEYMVSRIKAQPDKYYLILEPELVNVCFWYVPRRLRTQRHDSRREEELGKVWKFQNNNPIQEGFVKKKCLFSGLSHIERSYDAIGNIDGWISARRSSSQLLQKYHFLGGCHWKGRRFPAEWNGQTRTGSVNWFEACLKI